MKLLENFNELSLHPKNVEEIRDFILWLAMKGKLTVRWRSENNPLITGRELLSRNKRTREKLIKNKEIRNDKYNETIKDDEIMFSIPKSWAWSRLIDNCSHITDIDHKMPKAVENGVKFLSAKDLLDDGTLNFGDDVKMISEKDYEHYSKRIKPRRGDIIYSRIGTLGKSRIVKSDERFLVSYSCCTIRCLDIDINYLNYYLGSSFLLKQALRDYRGIGVPDLGIKKIKEFIVPLPSLEEQKAIVEVVNTLFKEVEQLEFLTKERIQLKESFVVSALNRLIESENTQEEWNFLQQHFSSFFTEKKNIKSLRATILQLALDSKLSIINEDNEIEIGNLIEFSKNGFSGKPNNNKIGLLRLGIECVTQSMDLEINIERAKYREIPSDKEDKYYVKNGDLFICRQNGNLHFVGKAKYYRGPDNKFIFSDSLIQLRPDKKLINSEFFSLIMSSMKVRNQLEKFCSTTAGNFSINGTNLKKVKVNVPTLNNQKAIVEKVNSLMALCDELEKQIETSQIQIEQLMQSCLKEVFEH